MRKRGSRKRLSGLAGAEGALPRPDLAGNPISLNYLWLVFPDDGTTAVPQVLEILPNP